MVRAEGCRRHLRLASPVTLTLALTLALTLTLALALTPTLTLTPNPNPNPNPNPRSTFEEALRHFELAERTEPDFYPKNKLLMAQAHARLGRKEEAQYWLQSCLRSTPKTPEDEQTLAEAARTQL